VVAVLMACGASSDATTVRRAVGVRHEGKRRARGAACRDAAGGRVAEDNARVAAGLRSVAAPRLQGRIAVPLPHYVRAPVTSGIVQSIGVAWEGIVDGGVHASVNVGTAAVQADDPRACGGDGGQGGGHGEHKRHTPSFGAA
jgi:hypothetical protein